MPTKRQRKLEKKRRKEKRERARRRNQPETAASLAYHGNKYKTEELVETLCAAETGILEAFVITDRELTDRAVETAVANMIHEMRRGVLPPLESTVQSSDDEADDRDFIAWRIRSNWHRLFQRKPRPGRDKLIGVLRTILGSIETWKSASPTSRGYLNYIEGFLGELGVSVDVISPETCETEEPDEDALLEIGREWCHEGDQEAAAEFQNFVEYLIRAGQAERVIDVCQRLIGETRRPGLTSHLSHMAIKAHGALLDSAQ